MNIQLQSNKGVIATIVPNVKTSVPAQKGLIYFFTKDNITPSDVVATRDGNNILLSSADNNAELEIQGFFEVCNSADTASTTTPTLVNANNCLIKLDVYNPATGYSTMTITPSGQPLAGITAGASGSLEPGSRIVGNGFYQLDQAAATPSFFAASSAASSKPFPWALTAAGLGGSALAASALGSSGGSNPAASDPNAISITQARLNADETLITVAGYTQPLAMVQIQLGNDLPITTQADSSGLYQIQSPVTPAPSLNISANKLLGSTSVGTANTAITKPTIDLLASSDNGDLDNDNITAKSRLVLQGKATAGAKVSVFNSANQLVGKTDADNSGKWSIVTNILPDGDYSFYASASQPLDTSATPIKSTNLAITVDSTVTLPSVTKLVNSSDGSLTLAFSSTEPNLRLTIKFGDGVTYNAQTNAQGVFVDSQGNPIANPNTLFKSGNHLATSVYSIDATSLSGATLKNSTTYVDEVAPATPSNISERLVDANGLNVRNPPGGVTLQGDAEPNSIVKLTFAATSYVQDMERIEVTKNADGTYAPIQTAAKTITIGQTAPTSTVTIHYPDGSTPLVLTPDTDGKIIIPAKTLTPSTGFYTNNKGGESVAIYVKVSTAEPTINLQANNQGKWQTSTVVNVVGQAGTAVGNYEQGNSPALLPTSPIKVSATDSSGNVSTTATHPYTDSKAPEGTTLYTVQSNTIGAAFNQIKVGANDTIIEVNIEAYTNVVLKFDGDVIANYTSVTSFAALGYTDKFFSTALTPTLLTEGEYTLTAEVTDASGNKSTKSSLVWVGETLTSLNTLTANDDVILLQDLAILGQFTGTIDALAGNNTLVLGPNMSLDFGASSQADLLKFRNINQIDMSIDIDGSNGFFSNSILLSFADAAIITQTTNGTKKLYISGDALFDSYKITGGGVNPNPEVEVIDNIAYYAYTNNSFAGLTIYVEQTLTNITTL